MSTHLTLRQIVYVQDGEVSYTPKSPRYEYDSSNPVDLTATVNCLVSSDNWMLVPVSRYELREVWLPVWLSTEAWLHNTVYWQWFWAMHPDCCLWPEAWQRATYTLPEAQRYAIVQLLTVKKFRSTFRASLKEQFVAWAETPIEDRRYASPFSGKQWDALLDPRTCLKAKLQANGFYHRIAYNGCPAPAQTHEHAVA